MNDSNISHENAKESLDAVLKTIVQTNKAVASHKARNSGDLLMIWGLLWVVGFPLVHFFPGWTTLIFLILNIVGGVAMVFWIWKNLPGKAAIKSQISKKMFWRIFCFCILLDCYIALWFLIFEPSELQSSVFLCTMAMFLFSVLGLWFDNYFLAALGIVAAVLIVLAYLFSPSNFFLWMVPTGGAAMLGTGLYFRLRWR